MEQPQAGDPRLRGLGAFAVFPDELVCYLLHRLDVRKLLALAQTSRVMRILACEEPLWLQKHLDRCSRPFAYKGSWRATYMAYHPACARPELTAADLVPVAPVPGFTSEVLYRRWYRCHVDLSGFLPTPPATTTYGSAVSSPAANFAASGPAGGSGGSIPYLPNAGSMSAKEFEVRFDRPGQPVLLGGLAAGWAGGTLEPWQPASLAQAFGGRMFKVTKPFLTGGRTKMRLADYLAYAQQHHDEEPLYIFDSTFGETTPELLQQYHVPPLFAHDLFACLGHRREDYRWLVVGPACSGASWHVDPSATSAWNTLLSGHKRWALYPPSRVPPGVEVSIDSDGSPGFETPTSLQWFLEIYPLLAPDQRPLELVQQPGDTIFLPTGWWHCVLNLDMTVAVTQNFVSPANLGAAVRWLALGAGSMFDPHLVPTYLERQQQRRLPGKQQQQRAEQQQERPAAAANAKPAKRRRSGSKRGQGQKHRHAAGDKDGEQGVAVDDSEEAAEAEAEARAAAAEHLQELQLGFSKDSSLGLWLRLLLQEEVAQGQEQAALSEVWHLVQQWTDVPAWQPRLAAACRAARLPEPQQRHEWLPLATGLCVVFEVANAIFKFFPPCTAHATAMGCVEIAAYLGLSETSSSSSAKLLHAGLLDSSSWAAAPAEVEAAAMAVVPEGPMPFMVLRKVPEVSLGSCVKELTDQQWAEAATAAGHSLAAIHSLPLPGAPAAATTAAAGAAAPAQVCAECCVQSAARGSSAVSGSTCTAWVARDGIAYSSVVGTVDMRQWEVAAEGGGRKQEAKQQQQELVRRQQLVVRQLFPGVAAALLGSSVAPSHGSNGGCNSGTVVQANPVPGAAVETPAAATVAAGNAPYMCSRCHAWQPFVEFLRRQRRYATKLHRKNDSLPPQLQEQVEVYLPPDPAMLVGCTCLCNGSNGGASGSAVAYGSGTAVGAAAAAADGPQSCRSGMPAWVHGDLTAGNLLLSGSLLQQQPQRVAAGVEKPSATGCQLPPNRVVIIDFADGGQGDPLWDFVVLLLRTFRCNRKVAQACLAAYCAALPWPVPAAAGAALPLPACWPARPPGVSPSRVAMCYTLLHELGPLHDVFKHQPQLWEAGSLEEVEQAAWGWLNAAFG